MVTPTRQPNRRRGQLRATIVDWARHWWTGSSGERSERDGHESAAQPRDLYKHATDRRSLWRDGAVVVGGLAVAMVLVGGGIWAVLHHLEQTQNKAPARAKPPAKSTTQGAADRGLQLSAVGLPAKPEVGHALVIALRALDTNGVEQTVLYDGSKVVSRQPGMATSVRWIPSTGGTHQLKVAVQLDNDEQAVSAPLPINVSPPPPRPTPRGRVPTNVMATAQTLVNAINTKNWDAFRRIDPSKSGWTDQRLDHDYRTLEKDTLLPAASRSQSKSVVRLYAGLVANEVSQTELFCVTWDVDPSARTAIQVYGRSAGNPLPAGAGSGQAEQLRLAATCLSG